MMIKGIYTLLLIGLIWSPSIAQEILGIWHEIKMQDRAVQIDLYEKDDQLSGTISSSSKDQIDLINFPIDKIIQKQDSLILHTTMENQKLVFRLMHNMAKNTFDGHAYINSTKSPLLRFGRNPVERNLNTPNIPCCTYTRQDSLRGSITPQREWWDLSYYHLDITIHPDKKYISGKNTIHYKVLKSYMEMQIDLQAPLKITKVIQNGKELNVKQVGNAHFINLKDPQIIGQINSIIISYEGQPKQAMNAPWDGGFSWERDMNGNHFVATSCQGLGASVWWPNKDHMYDEVDSMLISVTNPKELSNISNGKLRSIRENPDNTVTSHWFVNNPINNYGVNVNIGDYVHFSEIYQGEKGPLTMDYFVLRDNLEKAKVHFKDAAKTMKAFEHWFGPYPFYEDGYKLVEVPYLGMEHQSSVTYGNKYLKGYLGRDLSQTGWGLKFDFIIVHESGHEWFANSITYKDVADMWIHESFTNYSECLFLDYHYGKQAANEYVIGTRKGIKNDIPIIGHYDVNERGSGDMYPKGGNMLHILRQLIDDDEKWRQILRGLNEKFFHQTVSTTQIENYISQQCGMNLKPFFDQYLRTIKIPTLEYYFVDNKLIYKWINVVADFDMPLKVSLNKEELWIYPKAKWSHQYIKGKPTNFAVDPNFYISVLKHERPSNGGKFQK